MALQRRIQFIYGQLAWMVATVLVLAALGSLSYSLLFLLSLLGLMILMELTAPTNVSPEWRTRLRWLIVFGLLGFAYVIVRRLLEILPPELFT